MTLLKLSLFALHSCFQNTNLIIWLMFCRKRILWPDSLTRFHQSANSQNITCSRGRKWRCSFLNSSIRSVSDAAVCQSQRNSVQTTTNVPFQLVSTCLLRCGCDDMVSAGLWDNLREIRQRGASILSCLTEGTTYPISLSVSSSSWSSGNISDLICDSFVFGVLMWMCSVCSRFYSWVFSCRCVCCWWHESTRLIFNISFFLWMSFYGNSEEDWHLFYLCIHLFQAHLTTHTSAH